MYLYGMRMSRIYTKEILEEAVKNSINFTQVCKYLGKFPRGATYQLIKNRIIDYNINTEHFLGKASHSGDRHTGSCKKKHWSKRLVSGYKYRAKSHMLRRALIESGEEYKCKEYGNKGEWNGKELRLHVDHINGDWSNCLKDNLRFLCPNCHSQTDTYSGKNKEI